MLRVRGLRPYPFLDVESRGRMGSMRSSSRATYGRLHDAMPAGWIYLMSMFVSLRFLAPAISAHTVDRRLLDPQVLSSELLKPEEVGERLFRP